MVTLSLYLLISMSLHLLGPLQTSACHSILSPAGSPLLNNCLSRCHSSLPSFSLASSWGTLIFSLLCSLLSPLPLCIYLTFGSFDKLFSTNTWTPLGHGKTSYTMRCSCLWYHSLLICRFDMYFYLMVCLFRILLPLLFSWHILQHYRHLWEGRTATTVP